MYCEVGSYVYEPYRPQKIGKILELVQKEDLTLPQGKKKYGNIVKVQWITGEIEEINDMNLSNFETLISDHRKKLATHEKTLAKYKEKFEKPGG